MAYFMWRGFLPAVVGLVSLYSDCISAVTGFDYPIEYGAVRVCSLYAAEIFAVGVVDVKCSHSV